MADELPDDIVWPTAPSKPAPDLPDDIVWPSQPTNQPRNDTEAANQAFLANNRGFGASPSTANKLERLALGTAEPFAGTAQLAAHATGLGTETADKYAKQLMDLEAQKKAEAGLTPQDWDYWAGAGNILSPANFLPGAAIGRVAGPAKSIVGAGLRGVGAGAAYGAMEPVSKPEEDYWAQKQSQVGTGAVTGGITGAGAGALAKAISPAASKTAAQLEAEGWDKATVQHAEDLALMDREGVRTTLGQTTGMQRAEGMVGDVPFAGSQYRERVQAFREDANRAALNRAVPPGAQPIGRGEPVGTQGILKLKQDFDRAYTAAHAQMSFDANPVLQNGQLRANPAFARLANELTNLQSAAAQDLAPAESERLGQIIKNQIYNKLVANRGVLNGRDIQAINSKLRFLASGFGKQRDIDKQMLGAAIDDARQHFSNALMAQNTPEAAQLLKQIDNKYAHFVRVRQAAVMAKNNDGVFTGDQLLRATTQLNNSVGKGDIATGTDPFYQDLASAMIRLTGRMPNSGSPERGAALALGASFLGGHAIDPYLAAGIGSLTAAYTSPAQRALNAAVTMRPPGASALGRTLRTYGPTAGTRALTTGKVGQDQEPEMLPPVRVEQAKGGAVDRAQQLRDIESSPLSPEQKRDMRRKIIESALRNP